MKLADWNRIVASVLEGGTPSDAESAVINTPLSILSIAFMAFSLRQIAHAPHNRTAGERSHAHFPERPAVERHRLRIRPRTASVRLLLYAVVASARRTRPPARRRI